MKSIWGFAGLVASSTVLGPISLLAKAIDMIADTDFENKFDEHVLFPVADAVIDFADHHSETLTKATLSAAIGVIGKDISKDTSS